MTQCSQILALLEQGPHTTREILREVPCVVHSRVAELRKRGHTIVCEVIGTGASGHRYHLLDSLRAVEIPVGDDGFSAARSEAALVPSQTGPGHADHPGREASSGPTLNSEAHARFTLGQQPHSAAKRAVEADRSPDRSGTRGASAEAGYSSGSVYSGGKGEEPKADVALATGPDSDLLAELDWIKRELAEGIVVPSENARSRSEILKRQKREIEARL